MTFGAADALGAAEPVVGAAEPVVGAVLVTGAPPVLELEVALWLLDPLALLDCGAADPEALALALPTAASFDSGQPHSTERDVKTALTATSRCMDMNFSWWDAPEASAST